jgi:hypothetical protein
MVKRAAAHSAVLLPLAFLAAPARTANQGRMDLKPVGICGWNADWMSRSDAWKLASYEVAGGGGANVSVPDGTVERVEISGVPSGRNELLDALPDTPCLANFRLSLRDEALRQFGRVRMRREREDG